MERMLTIMRKEMFHIWRDPRTLGLILALPALLLVLLGYGISGEREKIPIAVADQSKSSASRKYLEKFFQSNDFKWAYDVQGEEDLLRLLDQNSVEAAILLPENFGRSLDTNQPTAVQIYINGSKDPTDVQTVELKLNAIHEMAMQEILTTQISNALQGQQITLPIDAHYRVLYNPNNERKLFMIPGLIPIILQVQALLLTALAIVREREQGTMEQLIVTPIRSWELMLGKMIPYLFVGIVNLFALLWLGKLLFGAAVVGNFWILVGLSIIFIIGSLGLGVLVSNLAQSQMQAIYVAVFIVLIPAIILSGLMFPRDNMPWVTYLYSMLLPVTHYLEITRGIMVRGVSPDLLWWSAIFPLIVLSIGYFVASVMAFRKRI